MRKIIFNIILLISVPVVSLPAGTNSSGDSWWKLVEKANENEDYVSALDYLSRIEISDPDNPELSRVRVIILNNLGNKYYRERDLFRARDVFMEALYIDPANYVSLRMLGEIAYFSQQLEKAEEYWNQALALQPGDRSLVEQLRKLKNEQLVEKNLESSSLANFDIRYHGRDSGVNVYDIQGDLLEAYQEIGYDFNYYPVRSIVVLLYQGQEFARIRNVPNWVGALYDGKIRLPMANDQLSSDEVKAILWHEYTHALINDASGNNCPRWLHEGLAQYQQSKVIPVDLSPLYNSSRHEDLIPLGELDKAFGFNQSPDYVRMAYAQAYSLTGFLVEKYGFWKINLILEEMKKGRGWREVFEDELLISLPELEAEWGNTI